MADKSTWWSITVYGEEIALVEDATNLPEWVKKIYGGREECPTTKREHFQGALQCNGQHRFGKIKGWLPTAHIEAAKSAVALKKYAMKEETATGKKIVLENSKKFLDAQAICRLITSKVKDRQTDRQKQFWRAVEEIIVESPEMTGQLMNPSLKNFWVNTAKAWERLEQAECDSITHIPSDDHSWEATGEYVDEQGVKWVRTNNRWIRYNDGDEKARLPEEGREEGSESQCSSEVGDSESSETGSS